MPPLNETPPVDKTDYMRPDREQAFLLFAVFCGSVPETAHALNLPPAVVQAMAEEHGWYAKIKTIIDLQASAKAGDVERAVNRAINYVQAHRMRSLLERVLRKMHDLSPEDLECFIFPQQMNKREQTVYQSFTARALADLASALEKCQTLTYHALNDTPAERKQATQEGSSDATAAEMHVRLAAAMNAAGGGSRSIRGLVTDAQLEVAQNFARVDLLPDEKGAPPGTP